jgi:Bacterial membrane protein YfhO
MPGSVLASRWRDRAGSWLAGRNPTALAAAIFALLSLLFVAPALVPGHTLSSTDYLYSQIPWSAEAPAGYTAPSNTELYDPAFQFIPWLEYTRSELPGQELLWNPHMAAGRPYLANMQSGVFSPFSLPSYLLPFWWSLGLVAALKLFLASFGTYLFARRLGQSFWGGMLAGCVFGFGLYIAVHVMYPIGSVYVLIPLLLVATDAVVRRPGPWPGLALALMVALGLVAGHPESTFHAVGFAVAYAVFRVALARDGPPRAKVAGWFVGAGIAGAALAAVVLLPFTELLTHSADFGNREGVDIKLPSSWLVAAALPEYFGTPTDATGGSVGLGAAGLFIARALYAGALPLMLALVAVVPALRGGARLAGLAERRFLLAAVALCLALTFGLPGLFDAVGAVPVLGQTNNTRLIVIYLLAVGLLAGYGLDDLRERLELPARRVALGVAVLAFAVPTVYVLATWPPLGTLWEGAKLALGFVDPSTDDDVIHSRALFWWGLFGLLAVALVAARTRGRLAGGSFALLAVLLVCADLFRAGAGFNPAISSADASLPVTPAIRYLQSQRPARFVAFDRGLAPNQAMRYGLYDARNYDFPIEKRYDVIWRRFVFPLPYQPGAPQWVLTVSPAALRVLGLLGVIDVMVPPDEEAYARRIGISHADLGLDGLRAVYDRPDGRIYRNPRALPRAFVVHAQHQVPDADGALAAVGDPSGPDLGRVAVTERPLPGLSGGDPDPSPARIVSYEPQKVVVESNARAPGLLVLSDVAYPGWKATVDGREEPIRRVDYLLRGVTVPTGASRVEFTYEPVSAKAGAWLSGVALLLLAASAGALLLARRRRGDDD